MQRFSRAQIALHLIITGLLVAPQYANGQSLESVTPGARLRVDIAASEHPRRGHERVQSIAGTLQAVRTDTLLLSVGPGSASMRVPMTAIRRVYVSRGRPPRWQAALRAAVVPALLGAASSAVGMAFKRADDRPSLGSTVASSAAWGAASGAAFGAWSQRERWSRLALPAIRLPSTAASDVRTGQPPNER
jgi:hypothetical protein